MIFGQHDEKTIQQLEDIKTRAVKVALMADGHAGYVMPVGGVAAYDNQVSVVGVGFDIACGNCAIKTDAKLSDVAGLTLTEIEANPHKGQSNKALNILADRMRQHISFGIGRTNLANDAPEDHELFMQDAWYRIPNTGRYRDDLRDKARKQLGTIGSGNHYVDVFVDRNDESLWVGVHFGSRGFGHTIASNFLALGQGHNWGDKGAEVETLLALDNDIGRDYWALMELAGNYAYAGREWVARKVVELIGANEVDMVHNHHNFAWKETHVIDGEARSLVVIRKGATPAFPGQRGFIGGSMGDDAVIVEGTNHFANLKQVPVTDEELNAYFGSEAYQREQIQRQALYSTVHGAGRVMSRTAAAGKRDRKTGQLKRDKVTGEILNPGLVTHDMMNSWIDSKGVILRGGGLDESPHAYRRLTDVLEAQGDTIRVLTTLKPIIVAMAGANEFDPYGD